MKIIFWLLLAVASANSYADSNAIFGKEFFNLIEKKYPHLDTKVFTLAESNDIDSAVKASDILFRLNDESMVAIGISLLTRYAPTYEIARLQLGYRYYEGIEIIPNNGAPKRIFRDYDKAIEYLWSYLNEPLENDYLYLTAFTLLGSAYSKNGKYEDAFHLFSNNADLVSVEPSGQAAFELASLYRDGNGVEKDLEKAFNWYSIASDRGFNMAIMEKNFLAIELGKE